MSQSWRIKRKSYQTKVKSDRLKLQEKVRKDLDAIGVSVAQRVRIGLINAGENPIQAGEMAILIEGTVTVIND